MTAPVNLTLTLTEHIFLGFIKLTDESWLPRLVSPQDSLPETSFSDGVRARDGKCVISGVVDRSGSPSVEAAHIFPRDNEDYWFAHGLARCITDADGRPAAAKLSSAQNGLALLAHVRQLWDQYLVSVNPDVGRHLHTRVHRGLRPH